MMTRDSLRASDVHPDFIYAEFDRLMQLDLDELLLSRASFQETSCPACQSNDVIAAFTHQRLDYKRCKGCDLLYISPAPTEDQHLEFVKNSRAMTIWRECQPPEMKASRLPMYQERVAFTCEAWKHLKGHPKSVMPAACTFDSSSKPLLPRCKDASDTISSTVPGKVAGRERRQHFY